MKKSIEVYDSKNTSRLLGHLKTGKVCGKQLEVLVVPQTLGCYTSDPYDTRHMPSVDRAVFNVDLKVTTSVCRHEWDVEVRTETRHVILTTDVPLETLRKIRDFTVAGFLPHQYI